MLGTRWTRGLPRSLLASLPLAHSPVVAFVPFWRSRDLRSYDSATCHAVSKQSPVQPAPRTRAIGHQCLLPTRYLPSSICTGRARITRSRITDSTTRYANHRVQRTAMIPHLEDQNKSTASYYTFLKVHISTARP